MDAATINELGRALYDAERTGTPRGPLSAEHPDLDLPAAYAIQEAYAQLRGARDNPLVGRKIGCTNTVIQQFFNIDTPDFGHIFADMVVPDGGAVETSRLIAPMVEPEIAFVLGEDLKGPGLTADDVLAATESVAACLEIIDSRITDWDIKFEDTVADNGSSALAVFGPKRPLGTLDLAAEPVRLLRDGEEVGAATGAAALGHPAASVAWLANAVGELGRSLRAGEWVLSGSLTSAQHVSAGQRYEAVFANLGRVSCEFV